MVRSASQTKDWITKLILCDIPVLDFINFVHLAITRSMSLKNADIYERVRVMSLATAVPGLPQDLFDSPFSNAIGREVG